MAQAAKVTKKKDVFQARSLLARPVEVSFDQDFQSFQQSKNSAMFEIGEEDGSNTFLSEINQEKLKEFDPNSRSDIN
jgi:hypothetical protein